MQNAACKNMAPNLRDDPDAEDIFFPDRGNYNQAVVVCIECPVRKECKDYRDKTNSKYGMWGAEKGRKDDVQ